MICVAGMPRSGTSLVTQLLHRCGLELGPSHQLMPASLNNTDGYWENLRFVQLNERLLAAGGGTWFAPPATLSATPDIVAEARTLVGQFDGKEPWGWKDPRNALTLSFWKKLVPEMKVLVCIRHPSESAASLLASTLIPRPWQFSWSVTRPGSPIRLDGPRRSRVLRALRVTISKSERADLVRSVGLELWRIYNLRILDETTPAERLVTHYESTLSDPRAELARILEFAGIDVPAAVADRAVAVVSKTLRHQRADEAPLPADVAALYGQLRSEDGSSRH